jgi:hypothetical protein
VMIGLGKPSRGGAGPEGDAMDSGDSEKEIAGSELKSALDAGDGAAICEAVKRIMELESYESEDEV